MNTTSTTLNHNRVIPSPTGNTYVGLLASRLAYTNEARFCTQCPDAISGVTGCFITLDAAAPYAAATEVFPDLYTFFQHLFAIGWTTTTGSGCKRVR